MNNLTSLIGFFVFVALAWALSASRKKICWRPIVGGVIAQLVIGVIVFAIPFSRTVFAKFSEAFSLALEFSREGAVFVLGDLAAAKSGVGFVLAFQALPFIIVFSAGMGFLYYIRLMPLIIRFFAWLFARSMKISGAESLCAASNLFVGIESAMTIRPYLLKMTQSELFLVLTVCMATVASSVMAVYVGLLSPTFPLIAGHLFSASLLSAPASVVIAKLMVPETETPETMNWRPDAETFKTEDRNALESVVNGAMNGAKLAFGVAVCLIAFVGLLGIVNGFLCRISPHLALQELLAWVFYPFVRLMGVSPNDVWEVSKMLGARLIVTEIPPYRALATFAAAHGDPRTVLIASYALCGFAHVASVAIFVGGIGALAPTRLNDLTRLGPRALLAANLATLMTGCVAGLFYYGQPGVIS